VYCVDAKGVTINKGPSELPGCQEKVRAPLAVRVEELPWQTAGGDTLTLTFDPDNVVTVKICWAVQLPIDPTTVYTMFARAGVTVTALPCKFPGYQVYEFAPVAERVLESPAHAVAGKTVVVRAKFGITVSCLQYMLPSVWFSFVARLIV
jgi:hypothetical protein